MCEFVNYNALEVHNARESAEMSGEDRLLHIKTHLWDLSTNLSKLNIFLELKILYFMKVKYITTTNKHFFDVSLPLDDEMKLKA